MTETYTLKQVAPILARALPGNDVEKLARQVRHWTLNGLVNTVGSMHTGTGVSRRYNAEEIRIAAIIGEFSRYGMTITELGEIRGYLRDVRRGGPYWDFAIEGKYQVFLEVMWEPNDGEMQLATSVHAKDVEKVTKDKRHKGKPRVFGKFWDDPNHQFASQIIVDLTKLFRLLDVE